MHASKLLYIYIYIYICLLLYIYGICICVLLLYYYITYGTTCIIYIEHTVFASSQHRWHAVKMSMHVTKVHGMQASTGRLNVYAFF